MAPNCPLSCLVWALSSKVPALLILFGALFTVAVCLACGRLLLRGVVTDFGITFVCGSAILSLAVFLLAVVRAAYPPVFVAFGIGGAPEKPREVYFLEAGRLHYKFLKQSLVKSGKTASQI